MGFFDDLRKAWTEGYENGKENSEKQNKWKQEEKEYMSLDYKKEAIIQNVLKGVDVWNLAISRKEIDLQLKYGDPTKAQRMECLKKKEEIREQLEVLRRPTCSNVGDKDNIDDFVDRYNAYRDERVALCVSYLSHPKATYIGIDTALRILIKSPYCQDENEVKVDCGNLKERFAIYKQILQCENKLSVLDYCFLNHLIMDTEMIPMSGGYLNDDKAMNLLSYITTCGNNVKYNDEMYGTHLLNLSFFKLSTRYDREVENTRNEILSEIFEIYLNEIENK